MENCFFKHKTVLLNEAVDALNINPNGIYIDGTFGLGGHSKIILSKLGKKGRLIAIDRDPQAINIAKTIKDHRFYIIHGLFSALFNYVNRLNLAGRIDGLLFDFGVSSLQINNAIRGFSFMHNGPLDMRMNQLKGQSAAEWLNTATKSEITWVLKNLGEERFAKRISNAIVINRNKRPLTTTQDLVKIILKTIPIKDKFKHPATRTFQAIRIWINNELEEIEKALKNSLKILSSNGRLSIISFHSLEDRIVKKFINEQSNGLNFLKKLPLTEEQMMIFRLYRLKKIGKLKPSKAEIIKNPRARSAILRIAENITCNKI